MHFVGFSFFGLVGFNMSWAQIAIRHVKTMNFMLSHKRLENFLHISSRGFFSFYIIVRNIHEGELHLIISMEYVYPGE